MRFDGTIKSWNDERGYGFIEPRLGGQDIFVHIKSLPAGTGRPTVGLWVSFEVETNTDGKKKRKLVQFAPQSKAMKARRSEAPAPWTPARTLALPGFAILYWYVATRWSFRPQVALAYAGVSAVAFVAYAIDKVRCRARSLENSQLNASPSWARVWLAWRPACPAGPAAQDVQTIVRRSLLGNCRCQCRRVRRC